jgi:hypothetical protein
VGLLVLAGAALLFLVRDDAPTGRLEAPRPEAAAAGDPAAAPASSLGVPFTIPLDLLVELLEDAVPTRFGSLEERRTLPDRDRVALAFELERRPFGVSMRGDTVRLEGVVEYSLRAWYDPPILPAIGASCGTGDGPRPRLHVVLEAPLALTGEWGLETEAKLTRLEPATEEERDRCEMTFLDFDVTDQVVAGAREFLEGHEETLDSLVASVELRPSFASWWGTLRDPIHLADSVWLVFGPESVRRGPIRGEADSVHVDLELVARPRIVVGPRPAVDTVGLPPLGTGGRASGVRATVEGLVEYATASRFLNREVAGTVLERGDRRIRLDSLRLHGLGNGEIAVEVDVSGDLEARLFLTGTPALENAGQTLAVPDLDFHVATRNVLLEAASWLRGFGLRELLRAQARWPADQAEDWLAEWLDRGINREVSSTLVIRGAVGRVSVTRVDPHPVDLRLHIDALADARIHLVR